MNEAPEVKPRMDTWGSHYEEPVRVEPPAPKPEAEAVGPPAEAKPATKPGGWRRIVVATVAAAIIAGGAAGAGTARYFADDGGTSSASPAAATVSSAIPDLISRVSPSIVSIDVVSRGQGQFGRMVNQEAAGTGFVIAQDGYIATNQHVIAGATSITVTLRDGTKTPATLVGSDASRDLAVIHINRTGLQAVTFGDSASLRVGESVLAIGNALALEGGPTATMGIVSALGRSIETNDGQQYTNLIQVDAAINSGDSGGPLLNTLGQVVGINTAGTTSAENIGFAIPAGEAKPILLSFAENK